MITSRTLILILTLLAAAFLSGGSATAQTMESAPPAWDREVQNLFSLLPVQDGGRVKPLDTYATFKLLKFRGRRNCPDLAGNRLTPVAWLMDCVFRPATAEQYKVFRVDNDEVIVAIGLTPTKKRDYYAYTDLLPARDKLMLLGRQSMGKEQRDRTVTEKELLALALNVREFEELAAYGLFARNRIDFEGNGAAGALFEGRTELRLSEFLRHAPEIIAVYDEVRRDPEGREEEARRFSALLGQFDEFVGEATALALFPPPASSDSAEWLTPAELVGEAFTGGPVAPEQADLIAAFEMVAESAGNPAEFGRRAADFHDALTTLARSRGEYGKVPLEVTYYRLQLFHYALMLYILAFLMVSLLWMRPGSRLLGAGSFGTLALSTLLLCAGITLRCIIRERPPVTTLYETILFVTAVAVATALFMEWVNRQGVALSIAAVMGVVGMFLANKYEAREGADTMVSMAAVLDTNFWLATHVTTITIGYAAGLLAGGLAHVFVIGKLFGLRRNDPAYYRSVTRMVYGSICFSLFFSVLGTVLGGIWANESWGRFWGWDPKENGALMIVLWQLALLHARQDGILRDYGINIAAIIGGIIIAFSWFGVNMLGVGLHSYGFADGIFLALATFYAVESLAALLGCLAWFRDRNADTVRA